MSRHDRQRGTASLEAVLMLPFVFLVLALTINLGFGWLLRVRIESASRFGGDHYVRQIAERVEEATAAERSREATRRFYFPSNPGYRLTVGGEASDVDIGEKVEKVEGGWVEKMSGFVARIRSRHQVRVAAHLDVPTGTLLEAREITSWYVVDGNTWTHREIPLSTQGLVDGIGAFADQLSDGNRMVGILGGIVKAIGWGVASFLWVLGMKA